MGACSAVFRISEMTTEVRAVRENELEEMVEDLDISEKANVSLGSFGSSQKSEVID